MTGMEWGELGRDEISASKSENMRKDIDSNKNQLKSDKEGQSFCFDYS